MIIEKMHLLKRSYETGVENLEVWRLVRSRHADCAFSSEGARLYGGRWT